VTRVSKAEFRKAQCKGALAGCEVFCGLHGCIWIKGGRKVAIERQGLFGSTYYLEA
jgi:hypothetical protein